MSIHDILQLAIAEFVAFLAFFAYPAFLYISLKRFAKKEAGPELWFLPDYGFRLVIRNIPGKRVLSDIKFSIRVRRITPPSAGASVATQFEATLFRAEDVFFVFPGEDYLLLQFQLEADGQYVKLRYAEKQETERKEVSLSAFDELVCDFSATVENPLNFDIRVAKRVMVTSTSLFHFWEDTTINNYEKRCSLDRVLEIT